MTSQLSSQTEFEDLDSQLVSKYLEHETKPPEKKPFLQTMIVTWRFTPDSCGVYNKQASKEGKEKQKRDREDLVRRSCDHLIVSEFQNLGWERYLSPLVTSLAM